MLHENDAAFILRDICMGEKTFSSDVKEGKIDIYADIDGLFRVNVDKLTQINMQDELMIATRHNNYPVKKGELLAGTRVIPLLIKQEKLNIALKIANGEKLLQVLPYKDYKVGIITTGSEVYNKRIEDTFTPVIIEKLKQYNLEVTHHEIVNDDKEMILNAIENLKNNGVTMIICTGGMSVDPDDVTPSAIKESGANIISYGAPVLPGAMFLIGYFEDDLPIMGLPGCVMYSKSTVFDLLLPRIVAGIKLCKQDLANLGHGGLCLRCPVCTFPHCEFGKGV
ncbi:molybdopterin-binding protein [Candidatus Epulonipiscium fishelsonii]|uniref:Molybdopterin-binding protein n=1 Tax=Candidatus Epulonipiscium fishelsonii TaxID=77094 RepID=A0ACC8XBP1_9FIRM|nr:molybdopterin-binding protein [Epulopiscium sp. SCG-D08WGA-EpuloA1]OON90545.1 MAG: molybdopterin-binding protein [Epulopiscium sp. AS2M-Bin002]